MRELAVIPAGNAQLGLTPTKSVDTRGATGTEFQGGATLRAGGVTVKPLFPFNERDVPWRIEGGPGG